jgi:hypothetical protein
MSRVQNSKPSRRLGWIAAALVLIALPATAQAQGLFFLFGSPSPYEIERQLAASGYVLTGPLTMRGDVYLADVIVRGEGPERLVIDAQSGRVMERYRARADHWREAPPPPSAWSDDPRSWNGPRPPASIGPGAQPPEALSPPNVVEAPKVDTPKLRLKNAEAKPKATPKPTPVANVSNPPPAAVISTPTATPSAASSPAASPAEAPASPNPAPSAAAAPTSPAPVASPSPAPSLEAAKVDAPSAAKPPPSPAPAAASAKSKAVNDIPVTPLD